VSAARRLVFIGPERSDPRSVKRIAALTAEGWQVTGFTFHRDRGQPESAPAWENIHLGNTYSRRYLHRLWAIVRAFGIMWRQRRRIREAGCLYVINPDNALLAVFGRFVCRRRVPLLLEIADVQPAMTAGGFKSRLLRALERFLLRRSQLLLTTSPGFLRHYFEPVQGYRGPVFLLENKVYPSASLIAARQQRMAPVSEGRWTIGYFGVLRCERSVDLICRLAGAFPDRLHFLLAGVPAGVDEANFHRRIGEHENITWKGPYRYPDDLPVLYAGVDFNWCFDFSAAGANSAWLLPNRIYEGGLFHCPALALTGTETAEWLAAGGLGQAFQEDLYESLHGYFSTLTTESWRELAVRCSGAPDERFAAEPDYAALSRRLEQLDAPGSKS
jgi:succinoglycan biosynthesis protein ExoL